MAQDKVFIGICKTGKYEDQVDIGFKQEHIDKLQEYLDESPSGFVNCRLNKSKSSGKPYMEIVPRSGGAAAPAQRPTPPPAKEEPFRSSASSNETDDLPF